MRIYKTSKWKDQIPGGKADKKQPKDFDKDQMEKGVKVEKEHTNDPKKAKEIVIDHLEESGDEKGKDGGKYYDKLDKMEKEIEKDKKAKKANNFFNLLKSAKKSKKKVNEYAVCTTSVGGKEGTNARSEWSNSAKDRYDRCLKKINPQKHKPRKKSETSENIKVAGLGSKKLSFRWNMPYEVDPAESDIVVTFYFTPGRPGWQHKHNHDPDRQEPLVEDIRIQDQSGRETEIDEHNKMWKDMLEACWDYIERITPN